MYRLRVATGILLLAVVQAIAGTFAPGTGIELSEEEITALEEAGQVVYVDGEKTYLIGDQVFSYEELSTLAFEGRAWTGGTLVYQLHPDVAQNPVWATAFTQGCARWSSIVPNVRCRLRVTEANYVEVRTHTTPRCVSYSDTTGMKDGGQVLSIYHDPNYSNCTSSSHWGFIGVIAHEIGHVYGLVHEHSRWDRPSYLEFLPNNLTDPNDPSLLYQYRRIPGTRDTTYTTYDFNSLMHYSATENAKPGTVVLRPSTCYVGAVPYIGSLGDVTQSDGLEMQHHYGLPIYDLLKEQRDPLCGLERVNPSEKKHFCVDLGENCGPGVNQQRQSAVTTGHNTWWCPRSFDTKCPGGSGPHRSCCTADAKVPFDVRHRRGTRSCDLGVTRRHVSNWGCGCPYYDVYARCASATFGFKLSKVDEYINGRDPSLRTLGKFAHSLLALVAKRSVVPEALHQIEDVLVQDFGQPYYFRALDDSRRKIQVLDHLGVISPSNPMARERLHAVMSANLEHRRRCEEDECSP